MATVTENTTGQPIGTLAATPTKRSLRDAAAKLSLEDAFGELIDNAVDNFTKQRILGYKSDHLTIDITIGPDEITIEEDSGGVSPEDLEAFVRYGASGKRVVHDEESGQDIIIPRVGVWGSGGKQATAKMGYDVRITSQYWDRTRQYQVGDQPYEQVMLRMDPRWMFDDGDWGVPLYEPEEDEELPPGRTFYRITELRPSVTEAFRDNRATELIARLRNDIRDVYGDLLALRNDITIIVNDEEIEDEAHLTDDALQRHFATPPGFEPTRHFFDVAWQTTDYTAEGLQKAEHKLKLELIVGLTARQDKRNAGVYMFGIPRTDGYEIGPRMFAKALQEESVGYSEGPNSTLRKNDPTQGRLQIYAIFSGDSEDIPWGTPGSPVKKGYNTAHPAIEQIKGYIKEVARPYARFSAVAKEIDVLPYSTAWDERTTDQKKDLIRRTVRLDGIEEVEITPVAKKVEELVARPYAPRPILTWDHNKEPDPPTTAPAFDYKRAQPVISEITNRDRELKRLDGTDPKEGVTLLLDSLQQREQPIAEVEVVEEENPVERERKIPVSVRLRPGLLERLYKLTGATIKGVAVEQALEEYVKLLADEVQND